MGKGKNKGPEFLVDDEALKPFDVAVNDIIDTPLGVSGTVIGVKDGALWLNWPGGIQSPASPDPQKAKNKEDLEKFGYKRRPQSTHLQRDWDERVSLQFQQKHYGGPGPKTAAMNLPLGPAV